MTAVAPRPLLPVPQWAWDAAASLLVIAAAVVRFPESHADRTMLGWVAALLPALLVLGRRRLLWPVLAACVVCFAVAVLGSSFTPGSPIAVSIAVYTVFVQTERRVALWTAGATGVVLVVLTVVAGGLWPPPGIVQVAVTLGFAAALGDAVRTRRAYIAEITERALRAEATREAEASRRVAEDRLRIARDLHDAVAHQISVISLNAGVASSALDAHPEVTREALGTIRAASRTVLGEIGDMLATLRAPEDAAVLTPTVGLSGLDGLLETFAASGLAVTVRRDDADAALTAAADVVAYRVIQEALTNAHKHGGEPRAHLRLSVADGWLRITVTNPAGAPASSPGHGLTGIRERVTAVRGAVEAGVDGTVFRLRVSLPLASGEDV
ncbi:MAG: histidine kinase [Microbacterium sp.]|uniref:sensor histidine kinase n=1 Tax=Microbacterium sp. TaxID=51671 RepID=UPI0039E6BE7A